MPVKIIERVVADLRSWTGRADESAGDAALVDAYLARRDDAAFAALVRRHGPMVFGVCQRILGHAHDAEDAFQAVFWVLARKANSIRPRAWVGNWLYGVALRTALKARSMRQRRREKQVDVMPPQSIEPAEPQGDLQALLDEEIARLSDKYRLAVVLCELEGRGRSEAAQQLGIPEGTLSSRLAHARRLLARRLTARGVTLSGGGVAALLSAQTAGATIPPSLFATTLQTAQATPPASAAIASLAQGVMAAMFLTKLKHTVTWAFLCLIALGGLAFGTRTFGGGAAPAQQPTPPGGQAPPPAVQADPPKAKPAANPGATPKALIGVWRVLRIESGDAPMGGAGGPGATFGGGPGFRMVEPPTRFRNNAVHFDGNQAERAFLHIAADRATFTSGTAKTVYRLTIGADTFDWQLDGVPDADQVDAMLGTYTLAGNQLTLRFGPDNGPRPKGIKGVQQTWVLMRPLTRQEIYQRLDQLQGTWKAVSGECNGEAFLPRELDSVVLSIADDQWKMTAPHQPAQPDALPGRFFGKHFRFVLDTDGARNLVILQASGPQSPETRILYELQGEELKACWSTRWTPRQGGFGMPGDGRLAESPKDFKTMPGSDLVQFVLKRQPTTPKEPAQQPAPPGSEAFPNTPSVDNTPPPGQTRPAAKRGPTP